MASPGHLGLLSYQHFALRHRGRLAAQEHPIVHDPDFHHATPGRHLKRRELALAKPLPPEVDQATMRGAAHRVFVHAQPGEERP